MAEPSEPSKVKLICGIIAASRELLAQAVESLRSAFGPVDIVSDVMDFDTTHYYDHEMGQPLYKQFVAFADLVQRDSLIAAKRLTNEIERQFATKLVRQGETVAGDSQPLPRRPINLDPGYIEPSKLVLASMKNFSHRIYLGKGVYAEVTLMFHKDGWEAFAWTFPDYASGRYFPFFTQARTRMRQQLEESTK